MSTSRPDITACLLVYVFLGPFVGLAVVCSFLMSHHQFGLGLALFMLVALFPYAVALAIGFGPATASGAIHWWLGRRAVAAPLRLAAMPFVGAAMALLPLLLLAIVQRIAGPVEPAADWFVEWLVPASTTGAVPALVCAAVVEVLALRRKSPAPVRSGADPHQ